MQRSLADLFADMRHYISCSKFKKALDCLEEIERRAPRHSVMCFEAKRQAPVIRRLRGVSYETTCEEFLKIIAEARREHCEFIDALTLRDLARLHMAYGYEDAAKRCLDESNQIINEALMARRDFNWPKPFAWRNMKTERIINYGLQGLEMNRLPPIIWCERRLRHAGVMYRDARLDNLIAGIEVARRTKEWRIVAWWAVKACAVALLRLHPRWKRAAEALILAVLGPEIRNRIKSKYLRKK